jgi:tetratricopeptide (TPR) repeat protein
MRLLFESITIGLSLASGCALVGHRGPSAADIAAGHQLAQQGIAAAEGGNWDQAEQLLAESLDKSPSDAASRRYLAEALWHRGAYDEAMKQIDLAVDADPSDAALALRAAEMRLTTEKFDDAIARANEAIRRDPSAAAAWALRGRAQLQLNHTELALADFHRALEFQPQDRQLLLDVTGVYEKIGQPTRKLTTLRQLIATYPPGQAPQQLLVWEGTTLIELGRQNQAVESLLAANRVAQPSPDVYYHLAQAYAAAGDLPTATNSAQQALALDARHAPSLQFLQQLAARNQPTDTLRR